MVNAHILLRKHLGIEKIFLLMGGSMGGYQAMEWCIMEKDVIEQFVFAGYFRLPKAPGVLQRIPPSAWRLRQTVPGN